MELEALPAEMLLRSPKLRIVAAGCTWRLEQRILEESNCFHELQHYFPHSEIQLCMVGPEIRVPKRKGNSKRNAKKNRKATCEWTKENSRFSCCLQQCTVKEFLKVFSTSYKLDFVVLAIRDCVNSSLSRGTAQAVKKHSPTDILCWVHKPSRAALMSVCRHILALQGQRARLQ